MTESTLPTCPSGHVTAPGAVFCGTCGQAVMHGPQACPNGHEVAPGQAFCESCGASVQPVSTATSWGTANPSQGKPWKWIVIVAAIVVLCVGGFLVFRSVTAKKAVTPATARTLIAEVGLDCDDFSSVAAGKGSTEADLFNATVISCDNNGATGEKDIDASYALVVAENPEDFAKAMKVSGLCENSNNESDVVAYGSNWVGSGQSDNPSATLAQKLASGLGGEVTTVGQWKASICSPAS